MRSSKVRYRLSPNEEAGILQQERDRRRKLRIQQVREQERAFAKQIRDQVEVKKHQELKALAIQLRDEWLIAKEKEQQTLKDLYQKTLNAVGGAHLSAETQPPYDKIREETKVENDKKAKKRGQRAIQKQQEEDEKRLQEEFAHVMARKTALEIERARAALIAKKPSRQSDLKDAETTKQPTRVLHLDGFSTTHYTIPTEYAEKADPEEQGDAKKAAREEEKRMKEEMQEKKQELVERRTKASLRQRHAQEKEELEKDLNHLLEELGQMEQADRRRRQLVVSSIPKQIFVPPHKRLEEKEENQKDLEQAFENMYMAKTDYAGDIELALEPALPQVEADLDLSSDISEEQFKVPERMEPKRFPRGLDEVKKKSPTGKRDTLRKLLLRVQSQKHDHKLRKKTEISRQMVDGLPQESSSPSEVTESASTSGITPSSVTSELTTTETSSSSRTKTSSSSQTSSHLSQHPLSSSDVESRHTSSGSGSLETGPISDESLSNGKSTLLHPLEAAYKLRKKEREENVMMRNHKTSIQEAEFEEFHPLQEQTVLPEMTLNKRGEIQKFGSPQSNLLQDENGNEEEEQKSGSMSEETQSLEEIPEHIVKNEEEIVGQSNYGGVPVLASNGHQIYRESDMHSIGSAGFQPLEPSQMRSLSPELQQGHVMGTTNADRLHQGHMVHIPFSGEEVASDGGSRGKMEKQDKDVPRRDSRDSSKETYSQTDARGKGKMAESLTQQKAGTATRDKGQVAVHLPTKGRVLKGGMSTNLGENHMSQSIRHLSPSRLESVRRAYPNIYEAVTGKRSNKAELDVESYAPSVVNTSYHTVEVSGMIEGDHRVESERLESNRMLPSKQMTSLEERDNAGSKVTRTETDELEGKMRNSVPEVATKMRNSDSEVATDDVSEGSVTEGGTGEKSSDELTGPSEEFKSSLHEYQKQLLKLQRTNELELLEAQAQLQERRQRLMNLYPQIQLPAYKPYIPAGYRGVPGRKKDGEENERSSGRMDLGERDTTGRNMRLGVMLDGSKAHKMPFHHKAAQESTHSSHSSGKDFEQTFDSEETLREMNAGLQGSNVDTTKSRTAHSAFIKSPVSVYMGGRIQSLEDVHRESKMPDHGPVHLQSFVTPPLHTEGSPSSSDYDSANLQFQAPLLGASRFHETQNEQGPQMCHRESWGTPHVQGERVGQAIENKTESQRKRQVEVSEDRVMQHNDRSEHKKYDFPGVELPSRSPHGVWRPVKELRVSLPSVEISEQSPLTTENASSLFSEQESSLTRTPIAESHGSPVGPPSQNPVSKQEEGQGVLLTPRKLAQFDGTSSFNVGVDASSHHGEPKVSEMQMTLLQEALTPRKLITPRMLVGEETETETRKIQDIHSNEDKIMNTSLEGRGTPLPTQQNKDMMGKSPSKKETPHYKIENKMTSYQTIPTDQFGGSLNSEGYFQKFESLKRDFASQGTNQTSKSSRELISPQDDTRGTLRSQMTSTLSWRSQSESSLDMGRSSKFEEVGSSLGQVRFSNENDEFVMQTREHETASRGSFSNGQLTATYDQFLTDSGRVSASKFLDGDKDMKTSKETVTSPQAISGSGHIIEDKDETTKDNSDSEEPTDRGLLEALKNLMLAKARGKVPGASTGTTNYFTHLDLRSSGLEKTDPAELSVVGKEDLNNDSAPSRMVFGAASETEQTKEKIAEGGAEGVKVPIGRHRIHHKPPVANQSKLLALEEMAPHELSTIIEVETPVFENLRTFPFEEAEVEKVVPPLQNGMCPLFDESVTSSSEWGTPHHHTPGSSQGSSSKQSQEIYIHQPMMVSSVEEEEDEDVPHGSEGIGTNDVVYEELSKREYHSLTNQTLISESFKTVSDYSMSSQIDALDKRPSKDSNKSFVPIETSSQQEVSDSVTISEGPINTSSENSFYQQVAEPVSGITSESLQLGLTSDQSFPLTSEVLKTRSPRQGKDQKLVTSKGKVEFGHSSLKGLDRSPVSHGDDVDSLDDRELKVREVSSGKSFTGIRTEPNNGDLTLEEGPLQETLTEDRDLSASHQNDRVEVPHSDSRISFQIPPHQQQDPADLDGDSSHGCHHPGKTPITSQFEKIGLHSSDSHRGFFEDLTGYYSHGQADGGSEDWSQVPSSCSEGTTLATSEAGIMEEPELTFQTTFQTTFDTNVTLGSIQEMQQDEVHSNPSDSLLSFIRHEEQFAHSTPMKGGSNPSSREEQLSTNNNQGPKEPEGPLTLQDALARRKAGFIKASQARQKEVKVHAGSKHQAGTAFALTIKNWQKAKLEAQQRHKTKGMKKQTISNKENVEIRSKVIPKAKTSQDRKAALKADKERTKRLYNQLEEVRLRKIQSERQKSYAENRQKRKEYEEKLKQRRLQLKNQTLKT